MLADELHICHVNAESLLPHWDVFRLRMMDESCDVIAVSESSLKPWVLDAQVALPGYRLLRRDRQRRRAGGVAIYVRDSISTRILAGSDENQDRVPEFLLVELWTGAAAKILVALLYRPPDSSGLQHFEESLLAHWVNYQHVIVLGDMNADFGGPAGLRGVPYLTRRLKELFAMLLLDVVPFRPTHHRQHSDKWIDIVAVDDLQQALSYGQSSTPFLSGHDLIRFTCAYNTVAPEARQTWTDRDWQRVDTTELLRRLEEADWAFLQHSSSVDDKVLALTSIAVRLVNQQAPCRKFRRRRFTVLGVTPQVRSLMREENRCYR